MNEPAEKVTPPHPMPPVVSVVEALVAALRRRVLDGQLGPGTPVAETEVAADYGVSRPSAKSALTTLVHEGLLRREANRPAYVPRLSAADVVDLFLVRVPLELEVIRTVHERGLVVADELRAAVAALGAVPAESPNSAFVEADLSFHSLLVEAVGSPRLSRLFQELRGEIHLSMVQTRDILGKERIMAEHSGVLRALEAGDVDLSVDLMREHLLGARRSLAEMLDRTSAGAAEG